MGTSRPHEIRAIQQGRDAAVALDAEQVAHAETTTDLRDLSATASVLMGGDAA